MAKIVLSKNNKTHKIRPVIIFHGESFQIVWNNQAKINIFTPSNRNILNLDRK
jgi:hypothetical protein